MPSNLVQKLLLLGGLLGLGSFFLERPQYRWILYVSLAAVGIHALVIWMLRRQDPRLARVYGIPGFRHFIDWLCQRHQLPRPSAGLRARSDANSERLEEDTRRSRGGRPPEKAKNEASFEEELLISEPSHFSSLRDHLRNHVLGHSAAVGQMVRSLERSIALRRRSQNTSRLPPLGVFLLAGGPGIGKRHLATITARAIYKNRQVLTLDLKEFADESGYAELFGTDNQGAPGRLPDAISDQPYQCVILDNIERATPAVLGRLAGIFSDGTDHDGGSGQGADFRDAVFFVLTTANHEELEKLPISEGGEGQRDLVLECLSQDSRLDPGFLGVISDLIVFRRLNLVDRASVIAQLMEKECRKFNLALDYVEAEVLASEVAALTDAEGFHLAPPRVSRLLREPLARAAQLNRKGVLVKRLQPRPT